MQSTARGAAAGGSRRARAGRAAARRGDRLSAADLRRLRAAAGTSADPSRSLFGPTSVTWRINREAALLLGGGRALLMQLAHPLVAEGVAAHSNFRNDPLQRLWRTLELTSTIVFAPAAQAIAAVREIERAHGRVKGKLESAVGAFPRGTSYAANRPELLFWVHATLVDSAFATYERFVAPLSRSDANRYYGESKAVARLFGVPDELVPARWEHFRRYMTTMLDGEELAIGPAGRDVAASILDPPLPFGIRHGFRTSNFFTRGMLPPVLRARYAFAWSTAEESALAAVARFTRLLLPALPPVLRYFPRARRALAG